MSKDNRRQHDHKKSNPKDIRLSKFSNSSIHSATASSNNGTQSHSNKVSRGNQKNSVEVKDEKPLTLEEIMLDVQRRQAQFDQANQPITIDEDRHLNDNFDGQERSRRTFYREFKKVVDASDIVIEVLDARDPLGCRCTEAEEMILTSGKNKKIILLLNKIDLIPRDNLDRWLKYLRNEFPTIPFRSSTQTQRERLGHMKISLKACDDQTLKTSNTCFGASTLMKLLSNYCRKYEIKTSITVGIVGFPNVGKSSVINSLKRAQACETGSTPGLTKQMQTVKLDKLIKLLDCPGIVLSKEVNPGLLVLRNCVRIETIENPVPAIEILLQRCSKQQIVNKYGIEEFQDVQDFLSKLATKLGCLKKGAILDLDKAAQKVLLDWNNGRLIYFTEPPERMNEIIHTEIVNQMRAAFDIEALIADEEEYEEDSLKMANLSIDDDENEPTDKNEFVDKEKLMKT